MEDIDIYGTHTKIIPDINTLRTLEKRKSFISKKLENKSDKNAYYSFLVNELMALEKVMNFIKWIIHNSTNDMVEKIIENYLLDNIINNDERTEAAAEVEVEADEEEMVYGIFEEFFNKNHLMEIVLSRYDGINYILMESKRRKANKLMWEREGKVKMTLQRQEKILRKINEIKKKKKMSDLSVMSQGPMRLGAQ
jgi:hypothetical protein